MGERKDYMIISSGQQISRKVFYPLFFLKSATVGAMPVTTAMVLMMEMVASHIVALVGMHTYGCHVAVMQLCKYLLTIII